MARVLQLQLLVLPSLLWKCLTVFVWVSLFTSFNIIGLTSYEMYACMFVCLWVVVSFTKSPSPWRQLFVSSAGFVREMIVRSVGYCWNALFSRLNVFRFAERGVQNVLVFFSMCVSVLVMSGWVSGWVSPSWFRGWDSKIRAITQRDASNHD